MRHRKPAIVVIRRPVEAIPACAFHQKWTVAYAARYYALFHEQLLDLVKTGNVLVVGFESIVSELATTVQSIAARHPSMFDSLHLPDDFEQRTDQRVRELAWGANPLSVSLPEAQRAPWVRQLTQVYEDASGSDIRRTVEDLYTRIMSSDSGLRTPRRANSSAGSIDGPSSQESNRAPM